MAPRRPKKSSRSPPPTRRAPRSPRPSARPAVPSIVPGSIPQESEGTAIPRVDRPHSQAVCRGCGRILELALTLEELQRLADLADRAPEGWRVDGLSFTLTGRCARCRTNERG